MSTRKFFHAGNATRTYLVGGARIRFETSGRNGSVWEGILETEDQDVIKGLKKLESEGAVGIREISESDYTDLKKKEASLKQDRNIYHLNQPAFAQPGQQVGVPHVVVENAPNNQSPQPEPDKPVDDLISMGSVAGSGSPESKAPKSSRKKK